MRTRIAAIRRRRIAGAALGLVLLTVAGLLALTRLGGQQDVLPAGVPKPPYLTSDATVNVSGYFAEYVTTSEQPNADTLLVSPGEQRRYLVVARCRHAGEVRVTTPAGAVLAVPCRARVGDHLEGALDVSADRVDEVFNPPNPTVPVRVDSGEVGTPWSIVVLSRNLPDQLPENHNYVLDGRHGRNGGSFLFTVPQTRSAPAFTFSVECVQGVTLTFRTARGQLAVASCTPETAVAGVVPVKVTPEAADRLGLRVGQRVRITVVGSGRDTDQWGVVRQG